MSARFDYDQIGIGYALLDHESLDCGYRLVGGDVGAAF